MNFHVTVPSKRPSVRVSQAAVKQLGRAEALWRFRGGKEFISAESGVCLEVQMQSKRMRFQSSALSQ